MSIVHDIWGNDVEITQSYVCHRNRLIDIHLIHTFQTKGKRLLINTFKQNEHVPTMCIFFDSKEKAEEAYQVMKEVYYGPLVTVKEKQKQPELTTSQVLNIFLATFSPFLVFLFVMLASSFFQVK
jgi:hypothetical protein